VRYSLAEIEAALEQIESENDELSALFRQLLREKQAFFTRKRRDLLNKSLAERQKLRNEYQKRWRAKRKSEIKCPK